jgi:multimeric flavodoxin WrbA
MNAILLDGSKEDGDTGERVRTALAAELQTQGWDVEHIVLREKKIGPCAGDFFCWIRSPGVCNVDDDNRGIAASIVASDLMVYLTPVTFGGYSSALKRMVDHQIQNVSPFFAKIEGETHHHKRYQKNPDLLAVGWIDVRPCSGISSNATRSTFTPRIASAGWLSQVKRMGRYRPRRRNG